MALALEFSLKLTRLTSPLFVPTQLIVEKASAGDMDHVRHSLDLLVDLLAVFVRILIILIKRAEAEKRREQQQRRNLHE